MLRFIIVTPAAILLSLGILWVMANLAAPKPNQQQVIADSIALNLFKATAPSKPLEPEKIEQKVVEEKPAPASPSMPKMSLPSLEKNTSTFEVPLFANTKQIEFSDITANLNVENLNTSMASAGIGSRDPIPVNEGNMEYPPKAQRKRIEGWVVFNYTITSDGGVEDVEIVDAYPPRIFERAVLRSVAKWRYQPAYENGKAVASQVKERKYVFQL